MKQTFYLYSEPDGGILFSDRSYIKGLCFMGKTELDVQPIKKEVEKVIPCPSTKQDCFGRVSILTQLPPDAYNIKVTYTVKE